MSGIVFSNVGSLPRDIDVSVTISKPRIENVTDFSVVCFITPEGSDLLFNPISRVRYYSSLAAVQADFAASSQSVRAATDFFAQSPRSKTFAIGKVYSSAIAGYMIGGMIASKTLEEWKAITTGSFKISIDGVEESITGVNFSSITTITEIASVLQTSLRAVNDGGFTNAVVTMIEENNSYRIEIASGTTGTASKVSVASEAASGTKALGSSKEN